MENSFHAFMLDAVAAWKGLLRGNGGYFVAIAGLMFIL